MRRRVFLGVGAGAVAALASGAGWVRWSIEDAAAQAVEDEKRVHEGLTDERLGKALARFGPVVAAHWTAEGTGHRALGPKEEYVQAFLELEPGGVARVLGPYRTGPVALPPVRTSPEARDHWEEIPAPLAAFAPVGAEWVGSKELTAALVRAGKATVLFDRASDTVYLMAAQLDVPPAG
ncbi:hypothetical protein [Kitasatospora terrestris]|uniref:Uncharacterized protein n=1 Tax=Kitasatospora terrestris TaxID=258051 RepID=A0ABP9DDH2_9ACTN